MKVALNQNITVNHQSILPFQFSLQLLFSICSGWVQPSHIVWFSTYPFNLNNQLATKKSNAEVHFTPHDFQVLNIINE